MLRCSSIAPAPEGEDPVQLFSATLVLIDIDVASRGDPVRTGAAGSFELTLSDGDALPSSVMLNAEDARSFDRYAGGADCSIVARDPGVPVTQTIADSIALPAPLFFTERGVGFGVSVSVSVSDEIDLDGDPDDVTSVSAVYATGATTLSTTGTECSSEDFPSCVDASLVEDAL